MFGIEYYFRNTSDATTPIDGLVSP